VSWGRLNHIYRYKPDKMQSGLLGRPTVMGETMTHWVANWALEQDSLVRLVDSQAEKKLSVATPSAVSDCDVG